MSGMDEREKALENKYAYDVEMGFNVEARCCKLFGIWVAEKFGLDGTDAATYAAQIVEANLEEAGFEDVFRKVNTDLAAKDIDIADDILRKEMEKAFIEAKKQVLEEGS